MATITKYTDIITLARAKVYLRVDDTLTEDDTEVESMINGAFLFMERYTNHIFKPKSFTKYSDNYSSGCKVVVVYDYPIVSTVPVDATVLRKYNSKTIYEVAEITYNAGYDDTDKIPDDFIQAALQIIKVWYFEAEKQVNETLIPLSVRQVLDTYRRFV